MKKIFYLFIFTCFYLLLSINSHLYSDEENSFHFKSPTIIIQNNFWQKPFNYLEQKKNIKYEITKSSSTAENIPFDIELIGQEDLTNMPAHNVPEALQNLPSIFISQGGDFTQPTLPSILGAEVSHTKILVDGIELNTQLDGTADIAPFSSNNISEIEISKGPLSPLWGSSLGGVIYLKTKEPQKDSPVFQVNSSIGSFQTYMASFDTTIYSEKASLRFIPEFIETKGYMPGGESRRTNLTLNGNYQINDILSLKLISGYLNADLGEYEQPRFFRRLESDSRTFYAGFKMQYKPASEDLEATFFLNGLDYDFERRYYLLEGKPQDPYLTEPSEENRIGFKTLINFKKSENLFSFEANIDKSEFDSNSLSKKEDVTNYYLSFNGEHPFSEKCSANGYIRFDGNSAFDSEFSFGAGISLKDLSVGNIRASLSRDFNAPPLTYRYMDSPDRLMKSNENLNAETAVTLRIALEKQLGKNFLFQLSPYLQKLDDGILLTLDSDNLYFYKNHDSVKRQGIEANVLWSIFEKTVLRAGVSFNDIINESNDDESVEGQGRLKYTLSLNIKEIEDLIINITGNYIWWDMPEIYNANDRNFIFNMKVTKKLSENLTFYASIYNIFDEEQYWIDVLPNPERSYEAGFSWKF